MTETPAPGNLPFPSYPEAHYVAQGLDGLPQPSAADAQRIPVYSNGTHMIVGVDQRNFDLADLPVVGNRRGISVRQGRLNDGTGTAALQRYLAHTVDAPALRWKSPPVVRFGTDSSEDRARIVRAVQLVNTALPEGAKMRVASDQPSANPGRGIYFSFFDDPSANYWGITFNSNSRPGNQVTHSLININREYTSNGDRRATILLAHELLHALGFFGGNDHVPEDLPSILKASRAIYSWKHGHGANSIWQPVSLLYPADREALRILYTRLRDGGSPTDFGPWESTSSHILGVGRHSAFGVRMANGYGEPWAYGNRPDTALAGNAALSGSATWNGTLLGFTPAGAAIAGDAEIGVQLATLAGTASFTALEHRATGTTWLDGDLGYTIAVRGNTFRETGGDQGRLTGIFVGHRHEGAAGTLERSDLTAAFGATRP